MLMSIQKCTILFINKFEKLYIFVLTLTIFDGIVWITNYNKLATPFYQKKDQKIKGTTQNADLFMGIGETIGCGERHQRYELVV